MPCLYNMKNLFCLEWMFCFAFLFYNFFGLWFASNSAFYSLFCCLIIVILDLLVILCLPVNKYANAYKNVVSFGNRDCSVFYAILNSHSNSTLGWPEHLNSLGSALYCYLVEHYCAGFCSKV